MTGPTHPAAGGGRFRAGHADREQAIETLKDAFVAGQLTKDELAARTGLALVARTRAELAELTADIPAAAATAAPARKRRRPAARARRRRPLAKAAAGSGACVASAFGLILFAANYLDPRGLGNPYHPWSGLCAMAAMFLLIAAMLIAVAGVSAHAEQRRSRRQLPRGPVPGVSDLDGGERADSGPIPPAPRDGRASRAEMRARQSRQHRRHTLVWDGRRPVSDWLCRVDADYPAHLLARAPAPPYDGEGPFALWHVSEDPALGRFAPRAPAASPEARPLVWAVDTRHMPMFWFPRDCPRGCIWPGPDTTQEDRERFFGQSAAGRVHVMEAGWLARLRECRLYAYRLPAGVFRPHEAVGGYWVADEAVDATERVVLGDLLARHADAGIELRIAPSIWPFWRRVASSTVLFSGSRLRNSAPHPDRLG